MWFMLEIASIASETHTQSLYGCTLLPSDRNPWKPFTLSSIALGSPSWLHLIITQRPATTINESPVTLAESPASLLVAVFLWFVTPLWFCDQFVPLLCLSDYLIRSGNQFGGLQIVIQALVTFKSCSPLGKDYFSSGCYIMWCMGRCFWINFVSFEFLVDYSCSCDVNAMRWLSDPVVSW